MPVPPEPPLRLAMMGVLPFQKVLFFVVAAELTKKGDPSKDTKFF